MKKKIMGNIFVAGGLFLLMLFPLLIEAANDFQSSAGEEELSLESEMFATVGDYQIKEDKVVFDFVLINHYSEVKELQFGSGQQFEIIIRDEKNEEVYRYSEGQFFTMALVYISLNPGESLQWQAEWDMKDKDGKIVSPGRYRAGIEILTIANEDEGKIEDSHLRTVVEFTLTGNEQYFENENGEDNRDQENTSIEYKLNEEGIIKAEYAKEIIEDTADEIIQALSAKDAERIAEYVHPEKGVRFTPYTYVNKKKDIVFARDDVRNFFADQNHYLWGCYDGTGDEINLTPEEYYNEFIYSADFINAVEIGYNEVLSSGNMLENQFAVYENPLVVEYYFPGFNPDFMGMDWRSLRLVFEEYEEDWKLTGIIHNQWTI